MADPKAPNREQLARIFKTPELINLFERLFQQAGDITPSSIQNVANDLAALITALGSMAYQNSNSVAINGGSISGITDLAIGDGGTGASTAANARTNLGLGSIATQDANNVAITGGSISGITDLAIADGGTGASDAANARTNLGLDTMATQAANNVSITGGTITAQLTDNQNTLIASSNTLADGAGAAVGTLNNAPAAGDPTKWVAIDDNGTTRHVPAW